MTPNKYAITLLAGGFHIIKLRKYTSGEDSDCKMAAVKNWPNSNPPTEEEIETWDNRNYGVLCGRNDLIVIDADSDSSCDWVRTHLPPTPMMVKTQRGYHFYYRCAQKLRDKKSINPDLPMDIKASGYVVGPGCMRVDGMGMPFVGYQLTSSGVEPALEYLPYLEDEDVILIGKACKQTIGESYLEVHSTHPYRCTAHSVPETYDYCFPAGEGSRYEACRGVLHFAIRVDELSYKEVTKRLESWDRGNSVPFGKRNWKYQLDWYWKRNKDLVTSDGYGARHRPKPVAIITPKPPMRKWDLPELCQEVPGVLQEYVTHYMDSAPIPHLDMAVFAAIGYGSAISSRRYSTITGIYSSLYMCTIAGTGCGKNHAIILTEKVLDAADCPHLIGPSGYSSAGGLLTTLKNSPNHIAFIDEFGDEVAGLKGRRNPVALALWAALRKLYSSCDSTYSPSAYSREGKAGKGTDEYCRIHNPGVTIFGLTTQAQLMSALSSAEVENGTLNRFIFNVNEAPRIKPKMEQLMGNKKPLPMGLIEWTKEVARVREQLTEVSEDKDGNQVVKEALRSGLPPASPVITVYSPEAQALIDGSPDLQSNEELFARYMENAHRLMLILAVSTNPINPVISSKHVRWAFTYLEHLYLRFADVFGTQHANTEHEEKLNFAYNVLRKESVDSHGKPEGGCAGMSKSRWGLRMKRYPKREREQLIAQLLEHGMVVFGKEPGQSRKSRFYIRELVTTRFEIVEDDNNVISLS